MIDIPSLFRNKTPDADKLTACGFCRSESGYEKRFPVMNEQYSALVTLSEDGAAAFRVFECETGEEYVPARVYGSTGPFVNRIHKECEAILKDITDRCFRTECFRWDQTKRILRSIKETYGAEPEFLWTSFPECAALRVPGKKSWFALAARIPGEKIGAGTEGTAEIINLKNEPKTVSALTGGNKAFPAYHMNKKHWYTVVLDGRIPDEELIALVKASYETVDT